MNSKTVKVRVYGTVQGVFFRHHTRLRAQSLGLGGWVRNCGDGSVEAVLYGNEPNLETMIGWLHHGPDTAVVDRVDLDSDYREELRADIFTIRY